MKKAGLIIGILLVILGLLGSIACLALPSLTNNRVNFSEALLGLIPAVIVMIFGFIVAVISAVLLSKAKKAVA